MNFILCEKSEEEKKEVEEAETWKIKFFPIFKLGKEALGFGLINFGNRDPSKWASKIN